MKKTAISAKTQRDDFFLASLTIAVELATLRDNPAALARLVAALAQLDPGGVLGGTAADGSASINADL